MASPDHETPKLDIPREWLLDLAAEFGIRDDVADLLRAKEAAGKFGLRGIPLQKLLTMAKAQKRLTRCAVARKADISRTQLQSIELGHLKNTSIKTALKLAHGYGVPWPIVICAGLRSIGVLPAPGAK